MSVAVNGQLIRVPCTIISISACQGCVFKDSNEVSSLASSGDLADVNSIVMTVAEGLVFNQTPPNARNRPCLVAVIGVSSLTPTIEHD